VKKCGCNFLVEIKVRNFKNKIQWAILKFSKIHQFQKFVKFIKSGFSSYGRCKYVNEAVDHPNAGFLLADATK